MTIINLIIYSNNINKNLNPLINANNISLTNNLKVKLSSLIFSQILILITFSLSNLAPFAIILTLLTLIRLTKKTITNNKSYIRIINFA